MKLKKRKKSSRISGRTHGHSAKLHKGKGSKGGKGMAGSGKRADQKKTKVLKLGVYFGKRGLTSKKTAKKKQKIINLEDIKNKFKEGEKEINLEDYKILGTGEVRKKFIIRCKAASASAREKIEKAGGKIIIGKKTKSEKEK